MSFCDFTIRRFSLIAFAVFLTGCAAGPFAPTTPLTEPRLASRSVQGVDGVELPLHRWIPPGRPRAVILALHGYGDSADGTYRWAAEAWSKEGLIVLAYDQRGFGANKDRRQWPGPERLVDDLRGVARATRLAYPDLPLVVLGHSMGGGVALAAAEHGKLEADALVLAAPAIAGGTQVDPVRRVGGWGLAVVAPDKRFTGDGLPDLYPTDHWERLREVVSGPWHYADPSGRELFGLLQVMDRAAVAAPTVSTPVLTLMGAEDDFLRPRSVRAIHNTIPGAVDYKSYPDGWHWLFRDKQADVVWADVARFVLSVERVDR